MHTLTDLDMALAGTTAGDVLTVRLPEGTLAPGFHITEVRLAEIAGLDCGGRRSTWREAVVEVMDSGTGQPMTVGRARGILAAADRALPGVSDVPLVVETALRGGGIGRYDVAGSQGGTVRLSHRRAVCKPASDMAAGVGRACCGTSEAAPVAERGTAADRRCCA